jgi:hypothetical protein
VQRKEIDETTIEAMSSVSHSTAQQLSLSLLYRLIVAEGNSKRHAAL